MDPFDDGDVEGVLLPFEAFLDLGLVFLKKRFSKPHFWINGNECVFLEDLDLEYVEEYMFPLFS